MKVWTLEYYTLKVTLTKTPVLGCLWKIKLAIFTSVFFMYSYHAAFYTDFFFPEKKCKKSAKNMFACANIYMYSHNYPDIHGVKCLIFMPLEEGI